MTEFQGDQYNLPSRQARSEDWKRFFESITDPDKKAQRKRIAEREARQLEKRKDTGL